MPKLHSAKVFHQKNLHLNQFKTKIHLKTQKLNQSLFVDVDLFLLNIHTKFKKIIFSQFRPRIEKKTQNGLSINRGVFNRNKFGLVIRREDL